MRREAAALVIALGLLVSAGLVPDTARARADNEEALHRAVLIAREAKQVRLVTHDGRTLEGKLVIIPGDSVLVLGDTRGGFDYAPIATADIRSLSLPPKLDKEPVRIGGFIGGHIAGLVGYALNDVNSLYTMAAGTILGYGVGYTFRDKNAPWRPLYPAPPPGVDVFVRDGWFLGNSFGLARADAARVPDAAGDPIDDWFLGTINDLGVTLSPHLVLAFGSGGWAEPDIIEFGAFNVYSTFGARAYWTPGVGLVMGAGGGGAVGEHNASDEADDATDWGWSVSGMAAYEFRVGRTTLIGPAISVDYMRFDGDYFDDVTLVTFALRVVTY